MRTEFIVSAGEMKRYDKNTICYFQMPSSVLMERAALAAAEEIEKRFSANKKILVAAGTGNNGGDGIALGRILKLRGYLVDFLLVGEKDRCSGETACQIKIIEKYGCLLQNKIGEKEYDIVIDALFGIGLSRDVEGAAAGIIRDINQSKAFVCSIDIPSGIDTDTGSIRGCAVRADLTVTFAYRKLGHILYPGCNYAGELAVRDIGISEESFLQESPVHYTYFGNVSKLLPERNGGGNKGSFGKLLVIAGSPGMSGACQLCTGSAYRIGAGMVKAVVPEANSGILQLSVPEALISAYPNDITGGLGAFEDKLSKDLEWADTIVIGPGLSQSEGALELMKAVLARTRLPLVIDADGLNLLAKSKELQQMLLRRDDGEIVLTPHVVEFSRLTGYTPEEVKKDTAQKVRELAEKFRCSVVCKDARTVVAAASCSSVYLNCCGNDGMATAGSGDVLAGVIGGLLCQGLSAKEAAVRGVFIHAAAGDRLAARVGRHGLTAGDLSEELKYLIKNGAAGEDD